MLNTCVSGTCVTRRSKLILISILIMDCVGAGGGLPREDFVASHGQLGRRLPVATALLLREWRLGIGAE